MKNTERAPGQLREAITNPSNDVTSFTEFVLVKSPICEFVIHLGVLKS